MPLIWREETEGRFQTLDPTLAPRGGYVGEIRFFIIYPSRVGPPEHRFYLTSHLIKRPQDPGCLYAARASAEELMAMAEQALQDWLRRAQLVEAPC